MKNSALNVVLNGLFIDLATHFILARSHGWKPTV